MAVKPKNINIKGASAGMILQRIIDADESGYLAGAPAVENTTASIQAVGEYILAEQNRRNAFVNTIGNKIFISIIRTVGFYSEWERYTEKGILEYGETIEEIYVGLVDPEQYQWTENVNDTMKLLFGKRKQDIAAAYHSVNFEKFYPLTITYTELRKAFRNGSALEDFIRRKTEAVYTSYRFDNYIMCKYMLYRLALDGKIYNIQIPRITAANANDAVVQLKAALQDAKNIRSKYTIANVPQDMQPGEAVVARTIEFGAIIDVESLANAFNLQYRQYAKRQITIDGMSDVEINRLNVLLADDATYTPFTEAELNTINKDIAAFVFDEDLFMNYMFLYEMDNGVWNGAERYYNQFLHVWKVYGLSPFKDVFMLSYISGSITALTITPSEATLSAGANLQFTPTLTYTGFINQSISWEVSGSTVAATESDKTYIDINGMLHVSAQETAQTLTVKATALATVGSTSPVTASAEVTVE